MSEPVTPLSAQYTRVVTLKRKMAHIIIEIPGMVCKTPEGVWKEERDPSTPQKEPKWICPDDCKNVAKKLDFDLPEASAPVLLEADRVPLPQTGGFMLAPSAPVLLHAVTVPLPQK